MSQGLILTPPNSFAIKVIEESSKPAGTWTYKFLTDVQKYLRQCRDKEFNNFLTEIFDHINNNKLQVLQLFKIAQMLSSIRTQSPARSSEIFEKNKDRTINTAQNISDTTLGSATKRLITNLFVPKPRMYSAHNRIHAFSTEPKFTSCSPSPTESPKTPIVLDLY